MDINLITFISALHKPKSIRIIHELILSELEKYATLHFIDPQDIDSLSDDDFKLIFIGTGGVERTVIQYFEKLPRPAIILADGMQNSLAAAFEISAWLRKRGLRAEILHGELPLIIQRIHFLYNSFCAQRKLYGSRIGVMGTPASWLIASNVDYLLAKQRWGVNYINIPLERVYDKFVKVTDEQVGETCANLVMNALACREGSTEEILKAARLHVALQKICQEEKLDAMTINCFKLINDIKTTGCLALSLLNDEGMPAGCEGDLQSVFTQLLIKVITGQPSFMANPSMLNSKNNDVVFAHCTVGIKQTEQFIIRNHFETETGISIQGIFPIGCIVTILRCGGESLDEYFLTTGTLTENTNYINLCRTQIRVKLNTSVDYFFRNPLGNHHLIILGNYEKEINAFLEMNACKRIE